MITTIAEIGINHNGDVKTAGDLASMAADCGATLVKLQLRDIESCYDKTELAKPCESLWGTTVGDKVRGRELSLNELDTFHATCVSLSIPWIASCFDHKSLRLLHERWPRRWYNKLASGMAVLPERVKFIEEMAAQGKPTLISTGLCQGLEDIRMIAEIFEAAKCRYVVNHCTALYPCPIERLDVRFVGVLRREFVESKSARWQHCMGIGYSGHEVGILPSVLAVHEGATFIERHITLDRSMYGADQAASLEAAGLRRLVRDVNQVETILGSFDKRLRGDEKQPVKKYVSE